MSRDLKQAALDLYKPPFQFVCGYILDAEGRTVADDAGEGVIARIRGWGRIQYLDHAEALQDAVGEMVAEALTQYWRATAAMADAGEGE